MRHQSIAVRYRLMCAAQVKKVYKDLDLPPGDWQLFGYGRLTELPTIKVAIWIRGYLRRVRVDASGAIVERFNDIQFRDLPVGEMVAWQIGCIFNADTRKVSPPQNLDRFTQRRTVKVAFSDANCKLLRRYDKNEDGHYLIPRKLDHPEDQEGNVYFLEVARNGAVPLLIPCTTILQTFWGRSSNLLHMLLDSRFLDFSQYVISPKRSFLDIKNRHAMVWLRQWSLDEDAKFLATIAFDQLAVSRGKQISASLHAAMGPQNQSLQRCVVALPPHEQPTELEVLVRPVQTPRGKRLYVQRFITSSYRPPFDSLTFDRDNDGRILQSALQTSSKGNQGMPPKKPINRPRRAAPRFEARTDFTLTQDHPGHNSTAETTKLGQFDPMFPGIAGVAATKLEQLSLQFENQDDTDSASGTRWTDLLSTLPGTSQSATQALGTVLSSGESLNDPIDHSDEPAGPPLNQLLAQVIEAKRSKIELLLPAGCTSIEVTPIFPWQAAKAHDGQWLFSLPWEHEDYNWAWLYSDPSQRVRKRGLCLNITFFRDGAGSVCSGYLVDVEGRFTQARSGRTTDTSDSPMLFIWRGEGQSDLIANRDLRVLILDLVSNGGTAARATAIGLGLSAKKRKHSMDGVPLAVLIKELFDLVKS